MFELVTDDYQVRLSKASWWIENSQRPGNFRECQGGLWWSRVETKMKKLHLWCRCKTSCGSTTPKIKVGTWFWILVSSVHPRVDFSWEMRKVGGGFNWGIGDSVNFSISCLTSLSRRLKRREATFPSWRWLWHLRHGQLPLRSLARRTGVRRGWRMPTTPS